LTNPAGERRERFLKADLQQQLQAALGEAYTLERELAAGGMSRVFLARETRLGRRVVVKVLRPELAADVSAERFEREILLAAQLQDPRIAPVLSAGDAGGTPYFTMPYVEGESLRARITHGAVPPAEALSILRDIALALESAHARGVVHRDIKPENVLLSGRTAMVTDFGIAKALAESQRAGQGDAAPLTTAGLAIGTPAYMAPEQATGDAVDRRADLYAWGVVAYELLAGKHPFADRTTAQALVAAHISRTPPPLAERVPGLPPALVALIERSLSKNPAARPEDATEVLRVLDGIAPTGPARHVPSTAARMWLRGLAFLGAVVVVGAVLRALLLRQPVKPDQPPSPATVAVLPFVNLGGDTTELYFADGLADEVTTALAKVPGLRVAARSSAFRFRGRTVPASEVGRTLGVRAVLEGTVRRSGDRLRVTAQLSNAADGLVLWADRYDRGEGEVFDVEDEITRAIVTALPGALAGRGAEPAVAVPRGTRDLEAYDLYLKGRFFWVRRGEAGLRNAIEYFGRAIARDPEFARAHAGLAMSYVVLPFFSVTSSADSALLLAGRSAARALALDSTLADAHLAMAYALKMQWRWAESEREFQAALALAPDDGAAHHWYGVYLFAVGRVAEAVTELTRARELEPFSTVNATDLAEGLYLARRFENARTEIQHAVELDTTESDTRYVLGMVYLGLGHPDSALSAFDLARRFGTGLDDRGYRVVAWHALRREREAAQAYAALRQAYREGRALPFDLAIGAIGAGDQAAALAALERVVAQRHMFVTEFSLPCDPVFDPLKSEPRFGELLGSAGMRICPAGPPFSGGSGTR